MRVLLLIILIFSINATVYGASSQQRHQRQARKRISVQKCEEYTKLVLHEQCYGYQESSDSDYDRVNCRYILKCNNSMGLIVGGEETKAGEFPHMAALGYENSDGNIEFKCGGSLISEKFVLTAAHCKVQGVSPQIVRLGDQNLATNDDGAKPIEYKVKRMIQHPKYINTAGGSDIALIELEKSVSFDRSFIRPACLQQKNDFEESVVATGWGRTRTYSQTSDNLMKVNLNVIDRETCREHHNPHYDDDVIIYQSQICAGGEKDKDTCEGDSGGPIQVTITDDQVSHLGVVNVNCVYNVVGVTSYGPRRCGSRVPAVYTRVSSYLDWIESIVWPRTYSGQPIWK